jgi:hypothetical protein
MVYHHRYRYHFAFDPMKVRIRAQHWALVLFVAPFSATVTRFVEILFLLVAYPNDWLNAPGLVFETETIAKTNSMEELNEIEVWVESVYPVFVLVLFDPHLSAFQLQVPVPVPVQVMLVPLVLLFHSLNFHLFLVVL